MYKRAKLASSFIRIVMGAACLVLLNTVSSAAGDHTPCEGCYPGISQLSCGVYMLNATSGCCGMGNGTSSCANNTFSVSCDGGGTCSCDRAGEDCERTDPLPE